MKQLSQSLAEPSQKLVGGLFLVGLSAIAVWGVKDLPQGTLQNMGPAMMPRWLAIAVGVAGLIFIATALLEKGERAGRWNLRGAAFVSLGVVVFALAVHNLGLLVAVPLSSVLVGLAMPNRSWKELGLVALFLTASIFIVFPVLLAQPMPVLHLPALGIRW